MTLDPSRVYAEGLSAGSMTASALGIRKSYLFAAVGGHSGGIFPGIGGYNSGLGLEYDATQKRGAVEMPYCSVIGTDDETVTFVKKDNWRGNSILNAWNIYQTMNGIEVTRELDFNVDETFGVRLRDRQHIETNKHISYEIGQLYKGDMPIIRMVAINNYAHWNFKPMAEVMWDFYKHFQRDPATKKLIYNK